VTAEIFEQGLANKEAWPTEPPVATESFMLPAFGLDELPAKYVDDGSQHHTERLKAFDPGPGYRFAPGGEYEAVAEQETAAGPVDVVFEAFVGARGQQPAPG
jgi:hypothetical protein